MVNSIINEKQMLLGTAKQMSSRAELHTRSLKLQKRTLSNSQIESKSEKSEKNRNKIVFIGHSATWLPSEHKITKVEEAESNNKIVFVGHSATWIPVSPSKQITSSFSTSAVRSIRGTPREQQNKENLFEKPKRKDNITYTSAATRTDLIENSSEIKNKIESVEKEKTPNGSKHPPKIVESFVTIDKKTKELKILNKSNYNSVITEKPKLLPTNKEQSELLDAIKNFKIAEESSEDLILSVPTFNLNKYVTTVDLKSMSNQIEKIVSDLEETVEKQEFPKKISDATSQKLNEKMNTKTVSKITDTKPMKKHNKDSVASQAKNAAQKSTNKMDEIEKKLNSKIPEKLVVLDKSTEKLKVVPSKEHFEVFEEAKRQNKTIDAMQASTIANYALKQWAESDCKNKVEKEEPMIKNKINPSLPADFLKKVSEIREYADKMSRNKETIIKLFSENDSKNDKVKLTTFTTQDDKIKSNSMFSSKISEIREQNTKKEPIFIGNICYWLPEGQLKENNKTQKLLNPINTSNESVKEQNKLFNELKIIPESNTTNEIVVGDNVLSRIIIKDKRKYTKGINLWESETIPKQTKNSKANINQIEKIESKVKFATDPKKNNVNVESFGVPLKHIKENIQLKDVPSKSESSSKTELKEKVWEKQKSDKKISTNFQAAQLEKNTEKYSTITNSTTNILKDEKITKSFEPIKVIVNRNELPQPSAVPDKLKIKEKAISEVSQKNLSKNETIEAFKVKTEKLVVNVHSKSETKPKTSEAEPISVAQVKPKISANEIVTEQKHQSSPKTTAKKAIISSSQAQKSFTEEIKKNPIKSEMSSEKTNSKLESPQTNKSSISKENIQSSPLTGASKQSTLKITPKKTNSPSLHTQKIIQETTVPESQLATTIKQSQNFEKSKIDKEIENLKKIKDSLLNKPLSENINLPASSTASKIITDQIKPITKTTVKIKNDEKLNVSPSESNNSFSSTWSKLETKPQTISSTSMLQTEVINETEKIAQNEEKLQTKPLNSIKINKSVDKIKETKKTSSSQSNFAEKDNEIKLKTDTKITEKLTKMAELKPTENKTKKITPFENVLKDKVKIKTDIDNKVKEEVANITSEKLKISKESNSFTKDNDEIKSTGFVLIEKKSTLAEPVKDLKKLSNSSETKPKDMESSKLNTKTTSFILVEQKSDDATKTKVSSHTLKKPNLNNNKINSEKQDLNYFNVNTMHTPVASVTKEQSEPIILGPPKQEKSNNTKGGKFVLVNSASQTYSVSEPLIDQNSDVRSETQTKQSAKQKNQPNVDSKNAQQKTKPEINIQKEKLSTKIETSKINDPKDTKNEKLHDIKSEQRLGKVSKNKIILTSQEKDQQTTKIIDHVSKSNEIKPIAAIPKISVTSTKVKSQIKDSQHDDGILKPTKIVTSVNSTEVQHKSKPATISSIVNKNLEDIAIANGIFKTHTQGKSKSINNNIFSYPELTDDKSKSQSDQPKLIVDKSLPNRFSGEQQNENISTVKSTLKVKVEPIPINILKKSEPELLKSRSPLERAYKKIDQKLDQIQNEIASNESIIKLSQKIKSTIADPNSLKELRQNFKLSDQKNFMEVTNKKSDLKNSKDLTENVIETNLNPKTDDENIIRKSYIPFSYYVTNPKDKIKQEQNKTKIESDKEKIESPFLNLSFLRNYIKEKPNDVKIDQKKSESIFKQVTNMIKEELFTYQEAPKEINKKNFKLAEESCASQPTVDGKTTIKTGVIYDQVKNMLKEDDLVNKNKSGNSFVIAKSSVLPGSAVKIQSILDDNLKKTSDQSSENLMREKENNFSIEKTTKADKIPVAYAELSVVPESIIVTESPPPSQIQSSKIGKKEILVKESSINKLKTESEVDLSKQHKMSSEMSTERLEGGKSIQDIQIEQKPITESVNNLLNLNSTTILRKDDETKSTNTELKSLKPVNKISSNQETNKPLRNTEEEELYEILGISKETSSKQQKITSTSHHKPSESVMDRVRNYIANTPVKSDISPASATKELQNENIAPKTNKDVVLGSVKPFDNIQFNDQENKIISNNTNQNSNLINSEMTKNESQNSSDSIESDKTTNVTDKVRNFFRTESNNNSPYHMVKPLSLLEHLTNMDTEQVKIDHHMKFLTQSRSNSITHSESSKTNSPRLKSPLLKAIENDEVLISPNPEKIVKISKVASKVDKITDIRAEEKISNNISDSIIESPLSDSINEIKLSTNQLSSPNKNLKVKKNDETKEEEEEEEIDEVKKALENNQNKLKNKNLKTKESNKTESKIELTNNKKDESNESTKDSFTKDSVKPLDKSRSEPINIVESPGPNILDTENQNEVTKSPKIKKDQKPINKIAISTNKSEQQQINEIQNSPISKSQIQIENISSNPISTSNNSIIEQNQVNGFQKVEHQPITKVQQVDFVQNQKFIKPSRPLIKQLNNVVKSSRNISSSVLEDFKIEMDRYNSAEATPEDKNKIVLKIKYLTKIEPNLEKSKTSSSSSSALSSESKQTNLKDYEKKDN